MRRLDIYAGAYFTRLVDSLSKDYPATEWVLKSILGDSAFSVLIADYLVAYPSTSPNIGEVGRHLPRFSGSHRFGGGIPFLKDLARLEWAVIEAFYAGRASTHQFRVPSVPSVPALLKAKIGLDPSVRLLSFAWPVHEIWRQKREEKFESKQFARQRARVLVYQQSYQVKIESIAAEEWSLLQSFSKGESLGEAVEKLTNISARSNLHDDLTRWFGNWVSRGIIGAPTLD